MVQTKLQIRTTGIDHVVLWVNDLERSKGFYLDLLGMSVAQENDWQCFMWCGQQQVALFHKRQGIEVRSGTELNHMALAMEPSTYEAVKERLEAEGIEVIGRTGDPTCVYFSDPDGHRLQLLYKGHE